MKCPILVLKVQISYSVLVIAWDHQTRWHVIWNRNNKGIEMNCLEKFLGEYVYNTSILLLIAESFTPWAILSLIFKMAHWIFTLWALLAHPLIPTTVKRGSQLLPSYQSPFGGSRSVKLRGWATIIRLHLTANHPLPFHWILVQSSKVMWQGYTCKNDGPCKIRMCLVQVTFEAKEIEEEVNKKRSLKFF